MGRNLVFVPECHSTNTLMAELATRQHLAEGSVLITANQTAGRGQMGTTWLVEPGRNITASFLVRPLFLDLRRQFALTQWVALAVAGTVEACTRQSATIKWPNDVLIGHQKVCGILIENTLTGACISQSIIGIGLNVNQEEFPFPAATSLQLAAGHPLSLASVFEVLCEQLERGFLDLRAGKRPDDQYLRRLYGLGQILPLADEKGEFEGVVEGISPDGRLVVLQGTVRHAYGLKEIRFRETSSRG